jgi:glycosyltransferase involved in cell wall biosynthesis
MIIGHYAKGIFDPGGVSNYIRRVGRAQREQGHTVRLFDHLSRRDTENADSAEVQYAKDDGDLLDSARRAGVDVLHIHSNVVVGPEAPVPVIRTLHGHQPYCPSGTRYFKQQARPCNRTYSIPGCVWGHLFNRCGSIRPAYLIDDFRRTRQEMQTLRHIPVIAVSDYLRREMIKLGYPAERIHVLRTYAPEPKDYAPPSTTGQPRFVYIGRMTPEKGVSWFLRAVQQVKTSIAVDIAGEGPQEAELQRLSEQLGLTDRVTFHGWINGAQVHELLAGARALAFPSVWHEPGGAVAGEAMANGRAVIMSRVGGMPEYVEQDVNGLLVEPNDVAGLAQAIDRLATDWNLARRLGETGRQVSIERFSFRDHVQTLIGLYERCIFAHSDARLPSTVNSSIGTPGF